MIIIAYIICAVVGWLILYYIIKTAVVHGIREARNEINKNQNGIENKPNAAQLEVQKRYEAGDISFQEYQTKWKELK